MESFFTEILNHKLLFFILLSLTGTITWWTFRQRNMTIIIGLILAGAINYIIPENITFPEWILTMVLGTGIGYVLMALFPEYTNEGEEDNEEKPINKETNKSILFTPKESDNPFHIRIKSKTGKIYPIRNSSMGIFIGGSSGAGKSTGPIYQCALHFASWKEAGIINDYKDYELTEILYPMFKEAGIPFHVFAIHDINRSIRINLIDPNYLINDLHITNIASTLLDTLGADSGIGNTKFFNDGSKSLMAGMISKLKTSFPEDCNLPTIIAMLLGNIDLNETDGKKTIPYGKLIRFLKSDTHSAILASTFLRGVEAAEQTAALFSTLATYLTQLATPEIFYLLGSNDIDLNINEEGKRSVISFVNDPKLQKSISPVNATAMDFCMTQMSVRDRKPSFVILDEAVTIPLADLGRRIRTLRSFNISFVYGIQDKSGSITQFEGKEYKYKDIISNLSTQFLGKVNETGTAKDYVEMFEKIMVNQKSYTHASNSIGSNDGRITTSKKEKNKYTINNFFTLKQGEFVMFSGGKDYKFRFPKISPIKELPPIIRNTTTQELEDNYLRIFARANEIILTI